MSVLSLNYLVFVIILAALYYTLPAKARVYVLFAGSAFYCLMFGWRHAAFLAFTALTCYLAGLLLNKKRSGLILFAVLFINFGLLIFTKFSPYLSGIFTDKTGIGMPSFFTDVLVPVGISFYTLRLAGYCVDVYRGKYPAEKNIVKFFTYAAFFPLYLQGPVEGYGTLAPELFSEEPKKHIYKNVTFSSQLMLWGFFQKLVIAERAAMVADEVFADPSAFSAKQLIIGAVCYSIQIYADFSGCVDICRGSAGIMGINIMQNFNLPYFAESIQDFWRRWHMSLSGWLRNYVYFPLGGNRKGKVRKYINVIIVFLVSGIWHGVGVHYIVWGLLHGLYQVAGALTSPLRDGAYRLLHIKKDGALSLWWRRIVTFGFVTVGWIFFRAEGTRSALLFIRRIATLSAGSSAITAIDLPDTAVLLAGVLILFTVSYYRAKGCSIRKTVAALPIPVRWTVYIALFLTVVIFGIYGPGYSSAGFIYMNF